MSEESTFVATSSNHFEPKLAALIAYLFSFLSSVILYFLSKDQFIRFHSLQSILMFLLFAIAYFLLKLIPFFYWVGPYLVLVFIILSIMMMSKAYHGKSYRLPLIGKIAIKNS